ncbi:MAG: class I SAM-dependent methyltransferase [Planctomycetes bacterium]|nr:class I SAM-dependent methyltransferase [Planctomycetota bacterium]
MAERAPCPVCTGSTFENVFEVLGNRFERCRECRFVRMADGMPESSLEDYYAEARASGEAAWQEHEDNLVKFGRMIERIEAHVVPGRFLDVGCSIGTSLVAARDRGWQAIGIELSKPVAEFGRDKWGLDIRDETLEDLATDPAFGSASFDAIFMHHTLEHVPWPDRILERSFELLRDGGVLFQALPNHGSLKGLAFGKHWSYGVTFEHVSHFTKKTVVRLIERIGFTVREVTTPDCRQDPRLVHDLMQRMGQGKRLGRWIGSPDGQFDLERYVRFITDRKLPNLLSNKLWPARLATALGRGQEVYVLAIKPLASA